MTKINTPTNIMRDEFEWLTIGEAIVTANKLTDNKLTESDIYRHALHGNIHLSIYFQSPVLLRKIKVLGHKIKVREVKNKWKHRLCYLEKNCFINKRNLIISNDEQYMLTSRRIVDTNLVGYEHVIIQRLLALSLDIPLPVSGVNLINYGFSVLNDGELFQLVEYITWLKRIEKQLQKLPADIASEFYKKTSTSRVNKYLGKDYFPVHDFPPDACFVIKHSELEKLVTMPIRNRSYQTNSTRISTPLSRMFWLACKHNEAISPLIRQPYKLLSIFEQWASADGITDRLSGDTLKNALERGSPPSS